ncbi:MAG: CoA transferase [Chloroflexi bacterium]|nr:CoA transferase [Chloroflexota bacterium]
MTGPLAGLTVLELGQGVTAPYCCLIMGQLGADVIKVEPPGGDVARRMGPFPGDVPHRERSALFLSLNRNKRSIVIDLDTATGQQLVRDLARHAGVVVEDAAPGAMAERGLGYESLSAVRADVVLTSITPFGQSGPYRDWGATELTLFALGGLMNIMGEPGRVPLKFGGQPGLHLAGAYAFAATQTALYLAEEHGIGQHVDVAILEGLGASHFQDLTEYEYTGRIRQRADLRLPIPARDGFVSFSVQAHQYGDFRRLILGEEAAAAIAAAGPDDAVARDRARLEGEMDTQILEWTVDRGKYKAYFAAQEAHVPAAYLADMTDLMESPQYAARGFWVEVDHPVAGALRYPGLPAHLTGLAVEPRPAPLLGQQTDEILSSLTDLTPHEIAEIRAAGVLG